MKKHTLSRLDVPVLLYLGLTCLLIAAPATGASEGAHVHGEGRINMAIEGDRVYLELELPGADIVGFEHTPRSAAETEKVSNAIAKLKDPLQILRLPAMADCRVISATARVDVEHDEHDEHESKDASDQHEATEAHGAFVAEYEIQCADIDALQTIEFTYFAHFANARSLDIVLISASQQRQQDIERSNPVINLLQ